MRKNIILLVLLFMSFTSCNKDWTDEQYEQYVSIKAEMNDNGVTPIYVRYKDGGKVTYQLPLIVSGSTPNTHERNVHIVEDLDTLNTMNLARFGEYRTDLYFKPLEQGRFYSIPETVTIPEGESQGICNIDFSLEGIDMTEKWVIPLRVVGDDSFDYTPHPRKNYAEAILKVNPFNDFSGSYSTSTMKVTMFDSEGNTTGDAMTANTRTAYVVNENTVFFYAGLIDSELEDRNIYKFKVEFLGTETESLEDNMINISCDHSDEIDFVLNTSPESMRYQTAVVDDTVLPYLEHHYVIFDVDYSFNDISSAKDADGNVLPIRYNVQGTLILERNINTLIPDEDQAIQW